MGEHDVHHHHYHYHYNYPFPPGIPLKIPQNDEPLNQEAAGRNHVEPSAEDEEEHSESGDIEDQQNPENRSPSPVQQEKPVKIIKIERIGTAVFGNYFSCFHLDAQSTKARARWTSTQSSNDDHQHGPPRKKARTSTHREQRKKPGQSSHITVIDKARIIATDHGFHVVNCDPSGPQVDICWRVPGRRNLWLARLGYAGWSRKKLRTLIGAQAPPGMSWLSYLEAPLDEENALSLIECSSSDHAYEDFERGGGQIVSGDPGSPEFVSALGRLTGFEVLRG
ncbi:hypothetical protein FGADI_3929 [Fusarium gaditjirri]|uniref:Uncharacterized protein n=1 Tax=Fusarium gaditjirri TaxID=282569 RepID=A0A8H4TET2_9HYPO|nr:hypothetical protein FGADI_3929 [Fusarium gaditjirri]